MAKTKTAVAWTALLLWMGLIFFLSSRPSGDLPSPVPDYVAHAVEYFVLGSLAVIAFLLTPALAAAAFRAAFFFSVLYGASDEFHQLFVPIRTCTLSDFLADSVGAGIAVLIVGAIMRNLPGNR